MKAARRVSVWLAGVSLAVLAVVPLAGASPNTASPQRLSEAAGSEAAGSAAGSGGGGLTLLSQSPWVSSGGIFHIRLAVAGGLAGGKLSVEGFNRLITRSDFGKAQSGHPVGFARYGPYVTPLSQLGVDAQGDVDIQIPVNGAAAPAGQTGALPQFNATSGSGVFPLQLQLFDAAGVPRGHTLTTFLVYAAGDPTTTEFPKLSVAVVVPFASPPNIGPQGRIDPPGAAASASLSDLAGVLQSHRDVPVSLQASPQTLLALESGGAADRATLGALASVVRSSDEVLPTTYVGVSMAAMLSSSLSSELTEQVKAAQNTFRVVFGSPAAAGSWVFDTAIDQATLGAVTSRGAFELVVPEGGLSSLPAASHQTTFAFPTHLSGAGKGSGSGSGSAAGAAAPQAGPGSGSGSGSGTGSGSGSASDAVPTANAGSGSGTSSSAAPEVYGADETLRGYFTAKQGPVLAASQLLAELAMIQLETPGVTRGVALVPPAGWRADPAFLDPLLGGLSGNPLLEAVTVEGLFQGVKAAPVTRSLAGQAASAGESPGGATATSNGGPGASGYSSNDVSAIRAARRAVQSFQSILANDPQSASTPSALTLSAQLLVAESDQVTEQQRQRLLNAIRQESAKAFHSVTLPRSSSITLTSTRGQLPLTILSTGAERARVELRLTSQRLIFHPFVPPNGHCTIPAPTSEVCGLVITGQNTTLKVPVEARSSGVFPLDVALLTPGGGQVLALDRDTVRSTAVSGVGVVLIILAVASLAVWWARDLRHGRRPRRMAPAPTKDIPEVHGDDPAVQEFFESPPPAFGATVPVQNGDPVEEPPGF